MRNWYLLLVTMVVLAACGGSRQNPDDLQHKIDSVVALDNAERLRLQGIRMEEENPMKAFYDSLALQPLPVACTEEYAATLPRFVSIPDYLTGVLDIDARQNPLAIALPESLGARLMMVALDNKMGEYSLWLFSLDDYFVPIDKLLVYSPPLATMDGKTHLADCMISHDYEIIIRDFNSATRQTQQRVYHVGDGRTFIEQK